MATFQEICVVTFSWVVLLLSFSVSVGVSGFGIFSTTPTKMVVAPSALHQHQQQQQQRQRHFRHISTTRYEEKSRNLKKKKTRNHLLILHATENSNDNDDSGGGGNNNYNKVETLKDQRAEMSAKISKDRVEFPPNILQPFPQAADPSYATTAPVGEGRFVVSRLGDGPTTEELTNENILLIVERRSNVTDLEVNTLVWKCLGYRFYPSSSGSGGEWRPDEVFPNWKERFPEPPDLIGMSSVLHFLQVLALSFWGVGGIVAYRFDFFCFFVFRVRTFFGPSMSNYFFLQYYDLSTHIPANFLFHHNLLYSLNSFF